MKMLNYNVHAVESLPYEALLDLFADKDNKGGIIRQNFYYIVDKETYCIKYLHKDKETKKVDGASGVWMWECNVHTAMNPTMAAMWAERNCTKGHWRVRAYVPACHVAKTTNVIMSDC